MYRKMKKQISRKKTKLKEKYLSCENLVAMQRNIKRRVSVAIRNERRPTRQFLVDPGESLVNGDGDEKREKELDGGFFQDFANLKGKQEGLIEAAEGILKHEADRSKTVLDHGKVFVSPPKEKALELYKELVYTIMYRLGKKKQGGDSLTDGEIFTYGREVLGISTSEHEDIYETVKTMVAPSCFLNVQVISGSELDAMDANGFSDPYCMLCLINNDEGEKVKENGNKRKKKLLRQFKQESDVKLTKIKMRTLNPEWKQHFKFHVSDIQKQVLRLEVWDKDDNSVVLDSDNTIMSIKGFRGAGRFLKEIVQASKSNRSTLDDFMGLVELPLKTIAEDGLDAWFQLESRSSKKAVGGKVHLRFTLSACHPDKTSFIVSSNETYKQFLNYFTRFDCQKALDLQHGVYWDCTIVDKAESMLLQYKVQHEISPLNVAVIDWEVYSQLSHDVHLPIEYLSKLLDVYRDQALLDEIKNEQELEDFLLSLEGFVDYHLKLLGKYRYLYCALDSSKCLELGKVILCLVIIYKLPLFQTRFPNRRIKPEIEDCIQKSTADWFALMVAYHQTIEQTPSEIIGQIVNLTNTVNADLHRGEEIYQPIFNVLRIPYLVIVFNKLEVLLSGLVENGAKKMEKEMRSRIEKNHDVGTAMFELFLAVRDLYTFKQKLPKDQVNIGGLDNFSDWFKRGVIKWLDMASAKAEERVVKAIELEEVRVIDSMVKHSTSAVDVSCCLVQICSFWNQLDWPDPIGAYMFLTQTTGIVGKCAMDYAGKIFEQLRVKGFYDDVGRFDVTDQLCIMMNNIAHVLQFLNYVPEALSYEKVVRNIAAVHDQSRKEQLQQTLDNILNCAKDDMRNKMEQIINHIVVRMKECLNHYILKLLGQQNQDANTDAGDHILEYIDSNLITLREALLTQVFDIILVSFWEMFVSSLLDIVRDRDKKLQQNHYLKISDLLEIALDFFHGDGDGIQFETLMSDSYKQLSEIIQLNKATTEELIEKFFMDRCEEQKASSSSLGSLTFKVFYCNRTKKLNIYVLNCKNLLPMDNNGTSDPYVTLRLLPRHLFPTMKSQKTKVQKGTLYPLFDESFQFEIPPPGRYLKEGATLLFTIFDQDRLSDDDIAGEVYFDLQNVIGLTSETVDGGFTNVPQREMPLTIGALNSETVKVLKTRNDQVAMQFVQKQKQRQKDMSDNVQKAFQQLST